MERRAEVQSYPDHPERFDVWEQVLCRAGVSGRCYWEVEWSGEVYISVSYKSISRRGEGDECRFGCNDQSWSLDLDSTRSSFWHNDKKTKLPLVASSRIGVYVDHRAGTLAFYSISDTMTLLHRVQTTFTHTLYPGFGLGFNPLKSDIPVQGYGGFYGELLLKLSQFLSERHRNYTPRNLEPFSFQIYTV